MAGLWRIFVLICALTSGLLLAGGGPAARAQSDTPAVLLASPVANTATPRGDQTLRLAGPAQGPYSLDPAFSRDLGSAFLIRQLFRGLTALDANLQPVPALAERIEISPDGLTYTFTLRQNATFHNGAPITAAAVLESLSRAVRPGTAGGDITALGGPTFLSDIAGFRAVASGQSSDLSGIVALDERTVQITLSGPRSTFLMLLATAPASIVDPTNVATGDEWWRTPNGSGPFRLSEWQPDDHLTLTRFDGFYDGPAPLERVEVLLGANALNPFNLYQAGRIDYAGISYDSLDRVLSPQSGFADQLQQSPLYAVNYIALRTDVAPLDDPNIRLAIQLGFPRDRVANVTFDGFVAPGTGLVPNGMLGHNWVSQFPAFDPDAAKAAIAASRYGSADKVPPIQIYVSGYGGAARLRDSLALTTGLRIDVIDVEWRQFVDGLAKQQFTGYELYWGADYPDPESLLLTLFGSGRPDNYVGYDNPEFNALLDRAASTRDTAERAAIYAEAQQILVDDHVLIPLYFDKVYALVQTSVKNLRVTPLGVLYLNHVWMEH